MVTAISNGDAQPLVSVLVPCRNERALIEQAVRSVLAMRVEGGAIEVIVADGNSDDGTRDVLDRLVREFPSRLRVVDNPEKIVSTGLNRAIAVSRGSIIIRCDAHTRYAPDYVARCVEVLRRTGADNVGGPWRAVGSGLVGRAIAAAFKSPFATGGAASHDNSYEGPVDTVYLGCCPRETFERFGGFDEDLVRNQDDELNLRIVRGGGVVWQSPAIRSEYQCRSELRKLLRQYYQYGYWKVFVIKKHRRPASWRHIAPLGAAVVVLTLAMLGFVFPAAKAAAFAMVCGYAAVIAAAATITGARHGWELLPVLLAVFPCYHLAYAAGWARGIVQLAVLRRAADAGTASVLTR